MKRTNLRDIIISCLLISTLGIATFIVSCSEQDDFISSSNNRMGGYQQHVHDEKRGIFTNLLPGLFANIAAGADNQIGSVGMGWLFSAMGITNNSSGTPNYQNQFNKILDDLNQINNTLNQTNTELSDISSLLSASNCNYESSQLSDEIVIIKSYLTRYTNLVGASATDSLSIPDSCIAPNDCMVSLTNDILSTDPSTSLLTALIGIQTNLSQATGTAISTCMDTSLADGVGYTGENGTFKMDSVYYSYAQRVLYQYYYWQTVGLGLYSEASHYLAWENAVVLGDTNYSSDSAQLICSIINSNIQDACIQVTNESNTVYNSILPQFQLVGAPYTGSDLIYQRTVFGEDLVWVKSLEDFTSQSGANCDLSIPLSLQSGTVINVCGPTVGMVGSTLSPAFTTYRGTQNFNFPGFQELKGLGTLRSNQTVRNYLDAMGFENMQYKVLIADDTLVKIGTTVIGASGMDNIDTQTVVPFVLGIANSWMAHDTSRIIYYTTSDFISSTESILTARNATSIGNCYTWQNNGTGPFLCNTNPQAVGGIEWKVPWGSSPYMNTFYVWGTGNANGQYSGSNNVCYTDYSSNTGPPYGAYNCILLSWSWSSSPGWSYYQGNSNPQPAFFIPVRKNFSGTSGCVAPIGGGTYPNYTTAPNTGVITMCGADFQNYISINLPIPPTCDFSPNACLNY